MISNIHQGGSVRGALAYCVDDTPDRIDEPGKPRARVAGVFRELRDYLLEVKYDPGAELAVIHEALGELRAIRAHLLKEAAK